MSEHLPSPKLTVEEELTLKMNDIMPKDWMDTPVGQVREKLTTLDGHYRVHLQQSRGLDGIVTSRLQIGEFRGRLPYNRWVEWSPVGDELTQSERPLPIDIDQLHRILDDISDQKSDTPSNPQYIDPQPPQNPLPGFEQEEGDTRWELITAASYDDIVYDYWVNGIGDKDSVIAQLQRKYPISEDDAEEALFTGQLRLHEVTDSGDEA